MAIVLICKNEEEYLEEWLDYYYSIGIRNFVIFDNDSTDDTARILDDNICNGVIHIKGSFKQIDAYNIALNDYGKYFKYMAFLDIDEFLYCDGDDIYSEIDNFFVQNKALRPGGLAVNWLCFGSSGYEKKPKGGVLSNFVWRDYDDGGANHMVKMICRPSRTLFFKTPHAAIFRRGYYAYTENGEKLQESSTETVSVKEYRINHYQTKSKEEYIKRISKGRPDCDEFRTMDSFSIRDTNCVKDERILAFLARQKMLRKMKTDDNRPLLI